MPPGYQEFFWLVYDNAIGMIAYLVEDKESGSSSFKFPSGMDYDILHLVGYGFQNFEKGGQLLFATTTMAFTNLGSPPKLLTILDIGHSPQAVAVLSNTFPVDDPGSFPWENVENVFSDPSSLTNAVCDKIYCTWSFRVGSQHHPMNSSDESLIIDMTVPHCNLVACSMLVAIKSFVEDQCQAASMNERFVAQYLKLRTCFLKDCYNLPKPHSNLEPLQALIANGTIAVSMEAFDCPVFRNSDRWFLFEERFIVLSEADEALAVRVTDFVLEQLKDWHEAHPDDSMEERDGTRHVWKKLCQMLGPCQWHLRRTELVCNDSYTISQDDGSIPLELWAIACLLLHKIVYRIQLWILDGISRLGPMDDDDDTS